MQMRSVVLINGVCNARSTVSSLLFNASLLQTVLKFLIFKELDRNHFFFHRIYQT